jgi:hypothetical protein
MSTYDYIYNDGIRFGNAAATSPTLNYYAETTLTCNATGPLVSTATTIVLKRIGTMVMAEFPAVVANGDSSAVAISFSAVFPAGFVPAGNLWQRLTVFNNTTAGAEGNFFMYAPGGSSLMYITPGFLTSSEVPSGAFASGATANGFGYLGFTLVFSTT